MSELFTEDEWWKLPLELRQRWWDETNYSRNPPSPELADTIREALKAGELEAIGAPR